MKIDDGSENRERERERERKKERDGEKEREGQRVKEQTGPGCQGYGRMTSSPL